VATIGHSVGLLLLDGEEYPDTLSYSFHAHDGEYLGWGQTTYPLPELSLDPPQGNVHTVYVPKLDADAKVAIRDLIDEHRARYGECRLYTFPELGVLDAWVKAGTPVDDS